MVRISVVAWGSEISLLSKAAEFHGFKAEFIQAADLRESSEKVTECIDSFSDADLILLHPSHDPYWDDLIAGIPEGIPVICYGYSDAFMSVSNAPMRISSAVSTYFLYGGEENIRNMLAFCAVEVLGLDYAYEPPVEVAWEGVYHPDSECYFETPEGYFSWKKRSHTSLVGIMFTRTQWVCGDLFVADALIRRIEKFADVIPVFCLGASDKDIGSLSGEEIIKKFFSEMPDAIIDVRSFIHGSERERFTGALKAQNVPVFHPLTLYHKTEDEWRLSASGMDGSELGWTVALPEFQGMLEMIPLAFEDRSLPGRSDVFCHTCSAERLDKIARRIERWIRLRKKAPSERKIAFILHNKPCSSVEGGVGSGAHLDTLESVAGVLAALKEEGYDITPPSSGEELVETIMEKKAVSEFRWTSIEEIIDKGGALALVTPEEYNLWFSTLPEKARIKVCGSWGNPPGEEIDGVPPAMIWDGKIVVTGVEYGNAVVCVQPKRGCAGSRCDGKVCRILHDPETPPTHQYLATYHYLDSVFGADAIVHVGTHGNLEFLPGKSAALSGACFPDIAIGDMPHFYIYNSDNPPEGTTAKRRAYATIIDHMQAVMTESGLYGDLKELEDQIAEYRKTKGTDRARAHALTHTIPELLGSTGLSGAAGMAGIDHHDEEAFDRVIENAHRLITELYETRIPDGMHIFGEIPGGKSRVEMIHSILRYDGEIEGLYDEFCGDCEDEGTNRLRSSDSFAKEFIGISIEGGDPSSLFPDDSAGAEGLRRIEATAESARDINRRIEDSKEIEALLNGFSGGYIEPGPSGLVTRGNPEILPTGRNFYSLDPGRVPTKAAWRIGGRLAEEVLRKYVEENGDMPENIAFYWLSSDIMWADGEVLSQMFALIGVKPVWKAGRVKSFDIIPPGDLGRPRIDITIRLSGILRDNFYNCVELIDEALKAVSALDEGPEINFVRKHTIENGSTERIFGARPGTYGNGVNLALYASAWEKEEDLSDVYVEWNSYSYGKGRFGEQSKEKLKSQLSKVDLTFNATMTDEYDLLGCCCYFGSHGGLTVAARTLSKKDVPVYYGDTRGKDSVSVRTLADEIRRVVQTKLLNPKWIEGMKRHGYKGASDISKRVTHVYGWEATTGEVDDRIFDDIAKTFILDDEMREFFSEKNPWALEEMGRRLLEANARGLWNTDGSLLEDLKSAYLQIEGDIEDTISGTSGNIQGGSIDVYKFSELTKEGHKFRR